MIALHEVLDMRRWGVGDVLADINSIMEEVTYKGVVFSADLLLFQKALVTLKGVIADVDSNYNRAAINQSLVKNISGP